MIEIKFLYSDIEGIKDFGIMLLQKGYIYKLEKNEAYAIFRIKVNGPLKITFLPTLDDKYYCLYRFSIGENPLIEFKAFALKIY